jgi:hypothetical protein
MFDQRDYPSRHDIRALFVLDVKIMPCPDAGDFRVDLAEEHAADIRADVEARVREALDDAMRDTRERILKVVGHMAERLRAYRPAGKRGDKTEGAFRDSLVDNVRDLAALLPAFNLTNDPLLDRIAEKIRRDLCAHDAETLRQSPTRRKATAERAEAILKDVSEFLA